MERSQQRLRVVIRGAVQGVGFRPHVYRLAAQMQLPGWVINSSQGVFIEVEGDKPDLDTFLLRVEREKPPRSFIHSLESSFLDPVGFTQFEIRHSEESGVKTALVLPDLATCPDCLRDISDPHNRRYQYPFTNCTNCGPRYSIIRALPYDRPNTSMSAFPMCEECRAEYENPLDRRFHAQPNACPRCGPHIALWDAEGRALETHHAALLAVAAALREGRIVAVKGLGGFHLMADARNDAAVRELRRRKHREEKPLAVMLPSLNAARALCEVSEREERLLLSPESPIVLLRQRASDLAPAVVPGANPSLGVMLPYTPLHHILMAELGFAVVATSGNLSDEPICTDEYDAVERLRGIADVLLVHNRPIVRHVDDSIVRDALGRELVLRRARGYAPLPITLNLPKPKPVLAVGAHLKNSVAITVGNNAFLSQHIGDLETPQANDAFRRVIDDLRGLYDQTPAVIASDMHPDYLSTAYAREFAAQHNVPLLQVQHHYAHIVSCMAENALIGTPGRALGVAWDGTGYGTDGTIWGGEFLLVDTERAGFSRAAHLRPFRLPGGDRAIKEPRRVALGLLYELLGDAAFTRDDLAPVAAIPARERAILAQMLRQRINAPLTSSAGRLFDACAALIGLRQHATFEGQAAMELEFLAQRVDRNKEIGDWRLEIHSPQSPISNLQSPSGNLQSPISLDWAPIMNAVLADAKRGEPVALIAARFHHALAEMIVSVARMVAEPRVLLSGGVFQNMFLLERTVTRLQAEGFHAYWHQRVPPNDGGIALGQAVEAMRV